MDNDNCSDVGGDFKDSYKDNLDGTTIYNNCNIQEYDDSATSTILNTISENSSTTDNPLHQMQSVQTKDRTKFAPSSTATADASSPSFSETATTTTSCTAISADNALNPNTSSTEPQSVTAAPAMVDDEKKVQEEKESIVLIDADSKGSLLLSNIQHNDTSSSSGHKSTFERKVDDNTHTHSDASTSNKITRNISASSNNTSHQPIVEVLNFEYAPK